MLLLIYAVKAPLPPWDLGPDPDWQQLSFSKPWFAVFAANLLQCCLPQCPEPGRAGEHLSREGLGLTSVEPPCCRHHPSVQGDRAPLSLRLQPDTAVVVTDTTASCRAREAPGGWHKDEEGPLSWAATSKAITGPNIVITYIPSRPLSNYTCTF